MEVNGKVIEINQFCTGARGGPNAVIDVAAK